MGNNSDSEKRDLGLCCDIGYKCIMPHGDMQPGDHVEVTEKDGSTIVVLSDGMFSGSKGSIFSILTGHMICAMISDGLPFDECIRTIADCLPVDERNNRAYATFSILKIESDGKTNVIQFGNPKTMIFRDGSLMEIRYQDTVLRGKNIIWTRQYLREGDTIVLISDGTFGDADKGNYTPDWQIEDIVNYLEAYTQIGFTSRTLADQLVEECAFHQGNQPIDDITACVVRVCPKYVANLMFGPPSSRELDRKMLSEFFGSKGIHIVSGGTTSTIAAKYLGQSLETLPNTGKNGIPPMSKIYGVDLVTEGVVTLSRVMEYAKDALNENKLASEWEFGRDGASMISRKIFEEATHVNFFVGQAVNEGNKDSGTSIDFKYKMHVVREMERLLTQMGKRVSVTYY